MKEKRTISSKYAAGVKSILMRLHEEVTFRSIMDIRELMQQDSWKARVGRMTKTLSFCRSESSSRPVV